MTVVEPLLPVAIHPTGPGVTIAGWGSHLPTQVVDNVMVGELLGLDPSWIEARSGIRERRAAAGPFAPARLAEAAPDQPADHAGAGTTATMAAAAGAAALARAQWAPETVELVMLCTTTPDQTIPATSSHVARSLGVRAPALDLNAGCAGFVYGVLVASGLASMGLRRILVIGADTLTHATNWNDPTSAFLFGDGAGAVAIEAAPGPSAVLGWDAGGDGDLAPLIHADHGKGMSMRGNEVFRHAVRVVVSSSLVALDHAGVAASDIAAFVPHQANRRIMHAAAQRLCIPLERIADVIGWTGNTSAASIPLALDHHVSSGRVAPGDLVLLSGFGAGMAWASMVLRWDGSPAASELGAPGGAGVTQSADGRRG